MMKKMNWERGLVRIAWTFGILGGAGFILLLVLHTNNILSVILTFVLQFMISLPVLLASLYPIAKFCFIFIGVSITILLLLFFIKGFNYSESDKKQRTSIQKSNNRIIISILVIVLSVGGSVGYTMYTWYRQTHTGSRSGQVLDVNSGKQIERAVVNYTWKTSGFMSKAMGGGGKFTTYETLTDKEGKYNIPNIRIKRESLSEFALCPEEVIIYKDGYSAYIVFDDDNPQVGRTFRYLNIKQPYREKNNIVKLYPFKEGESHDTHLFWIGIQSAERDKLLLKELESERKRAYK